MNMKGNLQNSMANPKSRVFLFVMITVIIVISVVAWLTRNKHAAPEDSRSGVTAQSSISAPSLNMESVAGVAEPSKDYLELQQQKEKQQAAEALSDSGAPSAALPSLSLGQENAIPGLELAKPEDSYNARLNQQLDEQRNLQQRMLNSQKSEFDVQQEDARNKQVQDILGRQVQLLAQNWQTIPQTYVNGSVEGYAKSDYVRMLKESRKEAEADQPKIFYKAGDILFGVILTAINSDEPGPVLARIISGPLANAKIIGTINASSIPQTSNAPRVSKSLILEFNLLNIPGSKISVPVMAVAIDPQTARTRLATSVDNHYMLRYGTFFASSFLAGLGQAISEQNQNKVITDLGSQIQVGSDQLKTADELKIAAGRTAEALSKSMNFLETPPTIKVASGTAVGILLQQDLIIGRDGAVNTQLMLGQNNGQNNQPGQQNMGNMGNMGNTRANNNMIQSSPNSGYSSMVGQPVVAP